MAVSYRSIGETQFQQKDGIPHSITITKPTGLAVGDIMVAFITDTSSDINDDITGWSEHPSVDLGGGNNGMKIYYKIADAGDVAASNFTFLFDDSLGNGGSSTYMSGVIVAVQGTSPVIDTSFIDEDADTDGGTTNNYAGGLNLSQAGLLIMAVLGVGGTTPTVSGYAIATDDPGNWSEKSDFNINLTTDRCFALATADRSAITSTGAYLAVFSSSVSGSVGALVFVTEQTNVNVSPAVISEAVSLPAPAVTGGSVVAPSVISEAVSLPAPTVTTPASKWVNTDKNSSSWVNPDKT